MEDTGIRDSSCVISLEQTNHRISQEWVAQRLLVPSSTAPQLVTTGCLLPSDAQYSTRATSSNKFYVYY
jgi:hypothetical protein